MPKSKTERTFNGQAIHWFNKFLESDGYPFKKAENDIGLQTYEGMRYPDALFWIVPGSFPAGTLMELKPPTISVADKEMLHTTLLEAWAAGVKYFATWNMREAVIWRVPKDRTEIRNQDRVKGYSPLVGITSEKDLDDPNKEELLKKRAQEILEDLSQLYRKDKIAKNELDTTFFVNLLVRTVHNVAPVVSQEIQKQYFTNKNFKSEFQKWAVSQAIENFEDKKFFETIGRQSIYRLLAKVLFYQALSRRFEGLPTLDPQNPKKLQEDLQAGFELVRSIDYEPIYKPDFPDKVKIPSFAAETLIDLIKKLHEFDFSSLPRDVIGRIFEQLIPSEERHSLGQYFTNALLVDFINSFTILSEDDVVLDPACGTGTFLTRAYHRIKYLGSRSMPPYLPPHHKLLLQIWGTDIAPFPATLAMINLAAQDLEDRNNFPMIFARDFFDFRQGEKVEIPEPRITNQSFKKKIELPEFSSIVANPPYIRQEKIEKYKPGYKQHISKSLLADWGTNMPKFSGQADIYVSFFAHAAKLLAPKGRLGFVTSNAWLDVEYGHELQKFFLNHFKIIAICESRVEPWFEDAAVNTVVTILERCDDQKERNKNLVKFVKIKKKLAELVPYDDKTQSMQRFSAFDKLTNKIEWAKEEKEDEDLRIRIRKQSDLKKDMEAKQSTAKWGTYLRAPDVYFEVLERSRHPFIEFDKVIDSRRGNTVGIVDFFSPKTEQFEEFGVEKKFLLPYIKSFKDEKHLTFDKLAATGFVFCCPVEKKNLVGTNALKYIKWGEQRQTKNGVLYPDVPSVVSNKPWYNLGELIKGDVILPRFWDVRFSYPVNEGMLLTSDTVFVGDVRQEYDREIVSALMNSTLVYLFTEVFGRVNLGDGLLTTYGPDLAQIPLPDPKCFEDSKTKLVKAFRKLAEREVKPINEEVKHKDRQKLDIIVLETLGLDPKTCLPRIYKGITTLVRERKELATAREQVKQARVRRDLSNVYESIQDEVFPNRVKKFPDAFIAHLPKEKLRTIRLPRKKLELGEQFFGKYELTVGGKKVMEAQNLDEAEYILFSQKEGVTEYKMPTDKKEVGKAVAGYRNYLKEKHDQLTKAALNRGLSIKDVENLSRQIWGELPRV